MFNNKTIPDTLNQIMKIVDKVKNQLQNSDFSTGKMSQSINYYGFNILLDDTKVWFGYALPYWGEKGINISPFFIQLKKEWFKKTLSEEQEKLITELGCSYDKDYHWIKAYKLENPSNVETELVDKIISDLNNISQNIVG